MIYDPRCQVLYCAVVLFDRLCVFFVVIHWQRLSACSQTHSKYMHARNVIKLFVYKCKTTFCNLSTYRADANEIFVERLVDGTSLECEFFKIRKSKN